MFEAVDPMDSEAKRAAWIVNGIAEVAMGRSQEFVYTYRNINESHIVTRANLERLGKGTLRVIEYEFRNRIEPPIRADELLQ
jgi:hypothetical protein